MTKNFFTGVRKVYVKDHDEATEFCPHCQLLGYETKLRYFYVNLDEAIWKCASSTCLYPFENFRFKNFANQTVYVYEKIDDGPPVDSVTQEPMCVSAENTQQLVTDLFSEGNVEQKPKGEVKLSPATSVSGDSAYPPANHLCSDEFDFDAFAAEFFKTDSPPESQSSFEMKGDFDLMDGFGCQGEYKHESVEEPMDLNGLNDMLDDLINENSSTNSSNSTISPVTCSVSEPSGTAIQPIVEPMRTVDLVTDEKSDTRKYVPMPRPKLSKCLKHIETKFKVKKEKMGDDVRCLTDNAAKPVAKCVQKVAHTPANRRPTAKCKRKAILPILRRSPAKRDNDSTDLFSLLSHKHNLRPMSILERLTSMDVSKASIQTMPLKGRPKIETDLQKKLRLRRRSSVNESVAKMQTVA